MNKIKRKFKKLISNPQAFIRDSRLVRKVILKNKSPAAITINKKTPITPLKKPSKFEIYINDNGMESAIIIAHFQDCLKGISEIKLNIGQYRLKSNECILTDGDNIELATIIASVENNTIAKGSLLLEVTKNNTFINTSNIIHKVNVSHMKQLGDFNSLYYYYKDRPECTDISKAKYALNAGIYTREIINLSLRVVYDNYLTLHQNDLNLFFRKLYRILGADSKLEQLANKLAQSIRKQVYPVSFIMLLAAFFTEAGEYDKAVEMAKKAKSKDKNAWRNNRFLGLIHLLYSTNEINEEWAKNDSELFKKLSRNEWEFEIYARENNICVIGNGPNELGKKQGTLIDENDNIARFNGAVTEYPFTEDYGRKTNIVIMNPRYYETQRNNKFGLDFIIISDGNLYSSKNLSLKLHDLEQYCENICLIPRKLDIQLTQEIGASPSSGLKFLTWLYKIQGQVKRKNIYGFSMIDQRHGMATSYCKGTRTGLNTIHNWEQEKKYMETIVEC